MPNIDKDCTHVYEKEFKLSEKEMIITLEADHSKPMFYEEDVKEFIRLLKEDFHTLDLTEHSFDDIIDKLAGDKLI